MRYVRHFVGGVRYGWALATHHGEPGDRALLILVVCGYAVLYPLLLILMPGFRRAVREGTR